MKCSVSELEIETIYNRIIEGDLNLNPDFQRGEVWTVTKKKKLIDSILRGWRIPPIHLIENDTYIDEVLDGQQRLVAIRDFLNNEFYIDGSIAPLDLKIKSLNKKRYKDLDLNIQRKIKKYSLSIIRLTDFLPEEPAELFYRLNQPATLTSAEQRNSYIGETRNQIKNLVDYFENLGADKDTVGFSNSRMAYDDILSKFCYALEERSIKKKITSINISEKYRNDDPFDNEIMERAKESMSFFINSSKLGKIKFKNQKLNINKATLFSWLIFSHRNMSKMSLDDMSELIYTFEYGRDLVKGKIKDREILSEYNKLLNMFEDKSYLHTLFLIFNQRASMGSTDANSILYRDLILEIYFMEYFEADNFFFGNKFTNEFSNLDNKNMGLRLEEITTRLDWGNL